MPLIYSLSELELFNANYELLVPILFIVISFLLISKLPTYSLKKITVPRSMTIFLLFGIVLFFGLLLIYTFKVITLSGLVYLMLIPVSFFHYRHLNKKYSKLIKDVEGETEDIL